jgi:hypothetical protein
MQSSTKGFELIIFDCDGLLVDSPVSGAPHGVYPSLQEADRKEEADLTHNKMLA